MVGAMALRQLGRVSSTRAFFANNVLRVSAVSIVSASSPSSYSARPTPARAFTLSTSLGRGKLGPLPEFKPSSSPKLDYLLKFLHEELKPTNPSPSANRKTFTEAVKLMTSPFDYDNVPGLVLGFAQAKMPIQAHQLEMIVRRLSLTARIDVLLKVLDQSAHNDVKINRKALREALRGFAGQNNHPDEIVAVHALRRANRLHKYSNLAHVLVTPEDHMKESSGDPVLNPKYEELAPRLYSDPHVTGLLAGMHAHTSARFNKGGLDYKGNTARLIKKFFDFYPAIECELSTPVAKLGSKTVFVLRRAEVEYLMLLDALRKAENVLKATAQEMLNNPTSDSIATVFADQVAPPKDQVQKKYSEYNELATKLRACIAEIEQTLGKWLEQLNKGDKGAAFVNKGRTLGPRVYFGEVTETYALYLNERRQRVSEADADAEAFEEAEAEASMQ